MYLLTWYWPYALLLLHLLFLSVSTLNLRPPLLYFLYAVSSFSSAVVIAMLGGQ